MSAADEKHKYQTIWTDDGYRRNSPGLWVLQNEGVLEVFKNRGVSSILDAGCGSGKAMRYLLENTDFEIHGFDIAENCLDPFFHGQEDRFLTVGNLWDRNDIRGEYDAVYCTDVMEHIPTEKVPVVLSNLRAVTRKVGFYGIALFYDNFGPALLGEPLHLTVKPAGWWGQQLLSAGYKIKKSELVSNSEGTQSWLLVFVDPAWDEANSPNLT